MDRRVTHAHRMIQYIEQMGVRFDYSATRKQTWKEEQWRITEKLDLLNCDLWKKIEAKNGAFEKQTSWIDHSVYFSFVKLVNTNFFVYIFCACVLLCVVSVFMYVWVCVWCVHVFTFEGRCQHRTEESSRSLGAEFWKAVGHLIG